MDKLKEINQQYANLCQQLGDLHYRNKQINVKIEELEDSVINNKRLINDIEERIDLLNEAASKLQKPSQASEASAASEVSRMMKDLKMEES